MSTLESFLIILLLMSISSFFSMAEISLAAARKLKLTQLMDEGDVRARKVLDLQDRPGDFFTVVQIGLNAVAIMGGIIGEGMFGPHLAELVSVMYRGPGAEQISFILSFLCITSLFILFADLIPKRIAMIFPESIAMLLVAAMEYAIRAMKPFVWVFNGLSDMLFKMLGISTQRDDAITEDDIYAVMEAGAQAGVLQKDEHQLIENVFEMQSVLVTSAMTARDSLIVFYLDDTQDIIRSKIAETPHSKFLVCDDNIDGIKGFVDAKELLKSFINNESINFRKEGLYHPVPIVPDTLSVYETMDYFRNTRTDFAVVMNEYALVVGVITMKDLMSMVMGDWAQHAAEEQIVKRDANSWLVDGATPVMDVEKALEIDHFPDSQHYETMAGFMMFILRKIPKRTDSVIYEGYKFEVVDIDNHRVDQLLVTRVNPDLSSETKEQLNKS